MMNMSFQKDVVVEMEVVEVKRTMVLGFESERMNVCGSGSGSQKWQKQFVQKVTKLLKVKKEV